MLRTSLATATILAGLSYPACSRAQATPPTTGTFSVNGANIFYNMSGTGPVMLLIHGFPLSSELFAGQLADLSSRFTVITVDLPGFGRSTTPNAQQTDATYAADLIALLKNLGIQKAIVGGHSMGGQVTLQMYEMAPALFSGMILFDTNPMPASIVEQAEWPGYALQARKMGAASIASAVITVMVTGDAIGQDPGLSGGIGQMVKQASLKGIAGGANALVKRPDFTPDLASIAVPTLVVEGVDDPVYPFPIARALKQAIPGAVLAQIPGVAHASMFQDPGEVDRSIVSWATREGMAQ